MNNPAENSADDAEPGYAAHSFDARGIAHRFRHSAIFGALGVLEPGEARRAPRSL